MKQWFDSLFKFSPWMRVAFGVWFLFGIYWTIAARESAPTKSSESTGSRQTHLALVNATLLLLFLRIPGLTQRFLPASAMSIYLGVTIEVAFFLLAVWARRHLGMNWSGEVRIAAEHRLVRSGPYRFVRHPIYTAVLGMYAGTAIVSGEDHALVASLVVAFAYWRKIRLEEELLARAFGEEFTSYQRDTWAVLPFVF